MCDTIDLSLVVPVSAGERTREVADSIRHVRAAARQVYACLFAAQAAGAEIDWDESLRVKPVNARAKAILAAIFDKTGKAPVYEARQYVLDHLLPTCLSFVWDQLRADVWTKWSAHDPEFPTASHGYLALNGVRRLAVFHRLGIGFPAATARPKFAEHRLTLKWDREMGPVELRTGTLDPGRWATWQRIASGEWTHGTLRLTERRGKLLAVVTYKRPCKPACLDAESRMHVFLSHDGKFLVLRGNGNADRISMREAYMWLSRLRRQRMYWEQGKSSLGSPKQPWGMPRHWDAVQQHISPITECRNRGQQSRNHAWARRIITRAQHWGCGTVAITAPETAELCGHPWRWPELVAAASYKGQLAGIAVLTTE